MSLWHRITLILVLLGLSLITEGMDGGWLLLTIGLWGFLVESP